MKTENLTKAYHSFDFFFQELREAHTDAVNSENQFAEAALFSLLEEAVKLQTKLTVIRETATQANAVKKKEAK
ncbi:hypothetical protein SBV1_370075 [Verrucomicrobia bacterium]|nr:hypothetical protein SBV1_370075 [Verrucomicrobiota bacterium]